MSILVSVFDIHCFLGYYNSMEYDFLEKLTQISDEENEILEHSKGIKQSLYTTSRNFIIQGTNLLKDKPIDIRLHTRFADFPLHGHDYMEIMYVYNGTITHHMSGETIVLQKGDILFMNRHIQHSIDYAKTDDIGINFILSDNFLHSVWNNLQSDDLLAKFISENFKQNGNPEYLQFRIGGVFPIRNLLDNLVYSLSGDHRSDYSILPQAVSLLLGYISLYKETLINDTYNLTKDERQKREITNYITGNYRTATLHELADIMNFSDEYLSRHISELFGKNFRTILLEQRMLIAEKLLLTTSMDVTDIITAVGYENKSYFHRIFLAQHGTTPHKWRSIPKV